MSTQPMDLRGKGGGADRTFRGLTLAAGAAVLVILVLIAYTTTKNAWPAFSAMGLEFFTSSRWAVADEVFGSLAFVFGTLVSSVIALVFAVPVSLGVALFITQVAPPWLKKPVIYVVDLLAVVPSVVFGLWGVLVLVPRLPGFYDSIGGALDGIPVFGRLFEGPSAGKSFMTAGIVLAIMVIPIITSLSREVIDTTPQGDREGALALGCTRWEMIRGAVLPHSRSGLVGAVMLGLGRAMGETIAVALVIGSSPQITARLFAPGDSMAAVIANQFGEADSTHRAALIGLGVSLFVITIIVNMLARFVAERANARAQGII